MDETVVDIAFVLGGFSLLMFGGEALVQGATRTVSYTHLTLPTNREV